MSSSRPCSIAGCDLPYRCSGYCGMHYDRSLHNAQLLALPGRARRAMRPFMELFDASDPDACWLWMGNLSRYGYGRGVLDGRQVIAHRAVYVALVGPIPTGLDLDHLCHNADPECVGGVTCLHRRCVNPKHLEPATRRMNVLRGKTPPAANLAKTQCINGHPFDDANTHLTPLGHRSCRACVRERKRAARSRQAAPA